VETTFAALADSGPLVALGPTISDNGLLVSPMTDAAGLPCINYTGGERTRSEFMFHYQVGSLDEEPIVLAQYLERLGRRSVAVAHDHSAVGRGYAQSFIQACDVAGIELTAVVPVSPLAEDLSGPLRRLRMGDPEGLVYLGLGVAARALAVAIEDDKWDVPVVANSALMFGYQRRDWRAGWEGWVYVDTVADDNRSRARLRARDARTAAGPIGVAGYDMGRLVAEAFTRAAHLTRAGVKDALEQVKQLPASSGMDGTTMGFGRYDHGALKGRYLVLRRWEGGKTVQVPDQ
jgi:ABC-type branched-subunit amino acid transport system substrate-binding protein